MVDSYLDMIFFLFSWFWKKLVSFSIYLIYTPSVFLPLEIENIPSFVKKGWRSCVFMTLFAILTVIVRADYRAAVP